MDTHIQAQKLLDSLPRFLKREAHESELLLSLGGDRIHEYISAGWIKPEFAVFFFQNPSCGCYEKYPSGYHWYTRSPDELHNLHVWRVK